MTQRRLVELQIEEAKDNRTRLLQIDDQIRRLCQTKCTGCFRAVSEVG